MISIRILINRRKKLFAALSKVQDEAQRLHLYSAGTSIGLVMEGIQFELEDLTQAKKPKKRK